MSRDDSGVKYGWAILVTLPTGYKSHDYNVIAADDGVTPVIFATEEEARAAATGPKYGPLLARIDYPWRIAVVTDPFPYYWLPEPEVAADSPVLAGSAAARSAAVAQARQIGVDAPLDLMEERNRLRYVIAALGRDLSFTSIPVVLRFLSRPQRRPFRRTSLVRCGRRGCRPYETLWTQHSTPPARSTRYSGWAFREASAPMSR